MLSKDFSLVTSLGISHLSVKMAHSESPPPELKYEEKHAHDVEVGNVEIGNEQNPLARELKSRHMQMIAIGMLYFVVLLEIVTFTDDKNQVVLLELVFSSVPVVLFTLEGPLVWYVPLSSDIQ